MWISLAMPFMRANWRLCAVVAGVTALAATFAYLQWSAGQRGEARVTKALTEKSIRLEREADLGQLDVIKCPAGHWDRNSASCKNEPVWIKP